MPTKDLEKIVYYDRIPSLSRGTGLAYQASSIGRRVLQVLIHLPSGQSGSSGMTIRTNYIALIGGEAIKELLKRTDSSASIDLRPRCSRRDLTAQASGCAQRLRTIEAFREEEGKAENSHGGWHDVIPLFLRSFVRLFRSRVSFRDGPILTISIVA